MAFIFISNFFLTNLFIGVLFIKFIDAQKEEKKGFSQKDLDWIDI
jgi:hypothetical protein